MEEDKYYTPNIKDFYFGYECEINFSDNNSWSEFTLFTYLDFEGLDYYIEENRLRTPYLTKEQIINEGWRYNGSNVVDEFILPSEKGRYKLFLCEEHLLEFYHGEHSLLFSGYCTSINEFRYVCKLLNI